MKILRAAPLLLAAIVLPASVTQAKDVRAYTTQDANAMLNEPVENQGTQAACGPKEILLDNGTCAATRTFAIARLGSNQSMASAQLTTRPATPQPQLAAAGKGKGAVGKARRPAGRPAAAREVPLQFPLGSADLSPGSKTNLSTLAKALKAPEHAGKRIRITGHTDRSGTQETNLRLSQARADAAAEYLVSQGVDRTRIDTLGVADTVMLEAFSPLNGRQRRVEVTRVE